MIQVKAATFASVYLLVAEFEQDMRAVLFETDQYSQRPRLCANSPDDNSQSSKFMKALSYSRKVRLARLGRRQKRQISGD